MKPGVKRVADIIVILLEVMFWTAIATLVGLDTKTAAITASVMVVAFGLNLYIKAKARKPQAPLAQRHHHALEDLDDEARSVLYQRLAEHYRRRQAKTMDH